MRSSMSWVIKGASTGCIAIVVLGVALACPGRQLDALTLAKTRGGTEGKHRGFQPCEQASGVNGCAGLVAGAACTTCAQTQISSLRDNAPGETSKFQETQDLTVPLDSCGFQWSGKCALTLGMLECDTLNGNQLKAKCAERRAIVEQKAVNP